MDKSDILLKMENGLIYIGPKSKLTINNSNFDMIDNSTFKKF